MSQNSDEDAEFVSSSELLAAVIDPSTDTAELEEVGEILLLARQEQVLARDKDGTLRVIISHLLRHPNITTEILFPFIQDRDEIIQRAIYSSPLMSDSVFERILTRGDSAELDMVCANPKMTGEQLRGFAVGATAERLQAIGLNPRASADLLRKLARHRVDEVRAMVARNPSIPSTVLTRLVYDPSWVVRGNAAFNPTLSPAGMQDLLTDSNEFVRQWAERFNEARAIIEDS